MMIAVAVQLDANDGMALPNVDQGISCGALFEVAGKDLHDLNKLY